MAIPGAPKEKCRPRASRYLAEAGFAVIGFTDTLNREISAGIDDPTLAITSQISTIFLIS